MKACVQLGLLCLSLLISSLHGEETDTETSKELLGKFDEQDIQMHRVRRQAEEENAEQTEVVASLSSDVNLRVKRQEKSKTNKRKKTRPGQFSLLGGNKPVKPKQTVRAKREEPAEGKRP